MSLFHHLCVVFAFSLALPILSAEGQSRSNTQVRLKLLNKKALDAYDNLEFGEAKDVLLEALGLAKRASVTKGPVLYTTYLNLGMVYGSGLNDRINAIKCFTEALRISPTAQLSPVRATPLLEELFQIARENITGQSNSSKSGVTSTILGFQHTPLDQSIQGKMIKIKARVGQDVRANLVVLYFRVGNAREYEWAVMREEKPGLFVGVIPGQRVTHSIAYYIEAQDESGQRIQGQGTAQKPNLIVVKSSTEFPTAASRTSNSSLLPQRQGPMDKLFTFGLMGGMGLGLVISGNSENVQPMLNAADVVSLNTGIALSPIFLAPELSLHINQQWQMSILGRFQFMNFTSIKEYKVSVLGEVRLKRFFGKDNFRYYLDFGAGAGQIRHRISLGDYDNDSRTPDDEVDVRVAGFIAAGGGGGIYYMFNHYFGWVLDVNALMLFPQNAFTINLDLSTGFVFSF